MRNIQIEATILNYNTGNDFSITNGNLSQVIFPGQSKTWDITFSPSALGYGTAKLRIHYGQGLINYEEVLMAGDEYTYIPPHLDIPTNLHVDLTNNISFRLRFTGEDEANSYRVEYDDNPSFSSPEYDEFFSTSTTPLYFVYAPLQRTYYVRLKTKNNNLSLESGWSNTMTYTWIDNSPPELYDNMLTPADGSVISASNVSLQYQASGGQSPLKYSFMFDLVFLSSF